MPSLTRTQNLRVPAIALLSFFATPPSAWEGPFPQVPIGMNIQGAAYWVHSPYIDPLLTSSEWITFREGDSPWNTDLRHNLEVDDRDWPLRIPQMISGQSTRVRTMINNCRSGDHVLLRHGTGELSWHGGARARQEGGRTLVSLTGDCGHAWMQIESSQAGDPVRDVRLIPVEWADVPESAPLFLPEFVHGLRPFHAVRFMDWISTNGSTQMRWSDRPRPGDRTFGSGRGQPWEHAIALAEELGAHPWISTPHAADEDYLRRLAQLFRDSLRPDLRVYLEYSNETWNWIFSQSHWVARNGVHIGHGGEESMIAADSLRDSLRSVGLRACGDPNQYCHPEKNAYMMGHLFRIWEPVWSADRSRLVTVATGQQGWFANSRRILSWLVDSMRIRPDAFSITAYMGFETSHGDGGMIPQSVIPRAHDSLLNNYFHTRWNARPDTVDAGDVINAMTSIYPWTSAFTTRETKKIMDEFGVRRFLVYEGGQHAQPHNQQDWPYNQAVWDAQIHPGMYDLYLQNLQLHDSLNCEIWAAFSYVSARESRWGSWGHIETYGQAALPIEVLRREAPKYAALIDGNVPRISGIRSGRPFGPLAGSALRYVVNGRLTGLPEGEVEVRSIDGRVLHRGGAHDIPHLAHGLVLVRPLR